MRTMTRAICLAMLALIVSTSSPVLGLENNGKLSNQKQKDYTAREVASRILAGKWVGQAISYSGYRRGQSPQESIHPSATEILEDLKILQKHFRLIRVYGSDENARKVLEVIRENRIKLKVMLGIWLAKEPGYEAENNKQVESCIKLANEFADVIYAVNVGNEILIYWTTHPVPEETVIKYVRPGQGGRPHACYRGRQLRLVGVRRCQGRRGSGFPHRP